MATIFTKSEVVSEEYKPLFGRRVLYSSMNKEDLSVNELQAILSEVLPTHFKNVDEINYLQGYPKGNQKILNKTKAVREEINNKVLENNAYHIVEFKKGYVFGDPIQYVQRGEGTSKEEITVLNKYMVENDKASKDKDLAEDWYICGTAYRFVRPIDDVDKPFEIFNPDPKQAGVVYSTDIDHKPLCGFYLVQRSEIIDKKKKDYLIATVYTRFNIYTFRIDEDDKGEFKVSFIKDIDSKEVNWLGEIPIIEYPLNKSRFGLVELTMPTLDVLNKISSSDIDSIEQFIQSLVIIFNADLDLENLEKAKEVGLMLLKDVANSQNKSDAKTIANKLEHSETKVLYDRLYNNMLTIAGVPRMSDKVSSGDTGTARLVGEGWTMADERAKQDELSFKVSEKKLLKVILKICKIKSSSNIKTLLPSDIEIKFTRNKADNMLVKAQTLLNLKTAQIDPEIALRTVEMWSDPAEVYKQSLAFYGNDKFWQPEEVEMANQNSVAQGQDGEVKNVTGVNAQ